MPFKPLALVWVLAQVSNGNQPKDLADYIEVIRKQGVTEGGLSSVDAVTYVISGASSRTAFWDEESESWGRHLQSNVCPPPNATKEQLAKFDTEWEKKYSPIRTALLRLADADRSGFVSTDEAHAVYEDFTAGLTAIQVLEKPGQNPQTASAAVNRKPEELPGLLARYRRILEGFPEYAGRTVPLPKELPRLSTASP